MSVVGVCEDMCPQSELEMREREGLLHPLEIKEGSAKLRRPVADPEKAVKSFSRAAAGQRMQSAEELRPAPVLMKTVDYLFTEVAVRTDMKWNVLYDFIFDRLRAVRQDMVIQGLSPKETVPILNLIVRFHTYAAYRLCEKPISVFDPYINHKHLMESITKLLAIHDDYNNAESCFNENHHLLVECLHMIINLGEPSAMHRGKQYLAANRLQKLVQKCLMISLEYWRGNYFKVCKLMKTLPPLLSCAAALNLPQIRRECLQAMSVAYNNATLKFPVETLKELLSYNNKREVIWDCSCYGISASEGGIVFAKSFKKSEKLVKPSRVTYVDTMLARMEIPHILYGIALPMKRL